ncbi:MAG: hypothetical protein RLZZ440_405 [Planctomycetota bacterium]
MGGILSTNPAASAQPVQLATGGLGAGKPCRSAVGFPSHRDGRRRRGRSGERVGIHGMFCPMRTASGAREKTLEHVQAASMRPPIATVSPGASMCPSGNQGATENLQFSSHGMARQACRKKVRGSHPRGDGVASGTNTPVVHKQRRCGSMKRMMFLGALVLGVTVCSQSFGFELLDRMLGCKGCHSCCEPGCDAGAGCCEPGCDAGAGCCEPGCDAGAGCCEPACDAGNGCCEPACDAGDSCCGTSCCGTRKCRKHDLFGGLKGLFEKCKRKHHGCCDSCCEPACDAGCCEPACDAGNGCCEPACDAGNGCCEPACDAGAGCCEPSCGAASCCGTSCRKKHTPIRDLLKALHAAKKRCHRNSCCGTSCCEPGCDAGNGCCEPACDAGNGCCEPACGAAPDCSASTDVPATTVAQVSRTVATK